MIITLKIKVKLSLYILVLIVSFNTNQVLAQQGIITGRVMAGETPVEMASIAIQNTTKGATTDSLGFYRITGVLAGRYTLKASAVGFSTASRPVTVAEGQQLTVNLQLTAETTGLEEVVITGTMKEVSRMESPVPVEIITPKFFQKNPTPSLFEAVGMVNGVQPQLNCNVCNTGDIHINGMEGPYTMILIDGMPIVSSLSTVYGLSGIPNSIVERIEVVKGPASSLYGSEAMGGIINVITKDPVKAPRANVDFMATTWREYNADASVKLNTGQKLQAMLGISYFNYQQPEDKNEDGFTDVTLQDRVSLFNKWTLKRRDDRIASLAARYVYEERWGGQTSWSKTWRGSDSIYGESIYTKRWEFVSMYQLPVKEKIMAQLSYNWHDQNSWYGHIPYMANQQVAFAQLYWDKPLNDHNLLLGASFRYTLYDDNTPGTASADLTRNQPMETPLPGVFVQDEWSFSLAHKLLAGYRYDHDKYHGNIHSPRVAYKWSPNRNHTLRASFGTGYRVVNLFTEDHAALTGAREVVIVSALKPEQSYNGNLNYVLQIPHDDFYVNFDVTGFYSYFTNKIVGDFDTDPNKIIYDNLNGYAISKGISLNTDLAFNFPLKVLAGITCMDVYQMKENASGETQKSVQLHAPRWSGNFTITYSFVNGLAIDVTGKWNGSMRLPVLPNDYRPEYSPWYCITNIQLSQKFGSGLEVYGGIKNLFNFVPANPIMRPFDPFDKYVNDPVNNPYGYTFDPSYNYAALQGARGFLGIRYSFR